VRERADAPGRDFYVARRAAFKALVLTAEAAGMKAPLECANFLRRVAKNDETRHESYHRVEAALVDPEGLDLGLECRRLHAEPCRGAERSGDSNEAAAAISARA
jgi:hypothetical protein